MHRIIKNVQKFAFIVRNICAEQEKSIPLHGKIKEINLIIN